MNRNSTLKKITMASIILASLTSGAAFSEDTEKSFAVRMNMENKIKIPAWDVINTVYGDWLNVGVPHSCQEWGVPTGTVPLGDNFQQSRACKQSQSRSATPVLQNKVLKTTKNGTPTSVQRDVAVTEFREAVGTGDNIVSERLGEYSDWSRNSVNYDCQEWTPSADDEPLYEAFTQSRTCSKNEIRSRDIFHVWSSGKETFKISETDSRVSQDVEQRESVGKKDYVYLMRPDPWSEWVNVGAPYECSTWTPSSETVNMGQSFEQSRGCLQMQESSRDLYLIWRSGPEFLYKSEERDQNVFVEQSREAEGEKDYIVTATAGEWGAWTDKGEETGCGTWSPSTLSVNYGDSFTQIRSCDQTQTQTRTIYNVWKSGVQTPKSTETTEQSITVTQSQPATGVKDYKTGEVRYGEYSEYKPSGEPHSCEAWSPLESTVNLDVEFTQERSCKQSESRQRTTYDIWASGKETVKSTGGTGRTVDVIQSREAVGTKNVVVSSQSSYGVWEFTGDPTCGDWSPSTSSVDYGTSFEQSRSCSRPRERVLTTYEIFSDGSKVAKSAVKETGNYEYSNSQSVTGTKDYIVNSAWDNNYSTTDNGWVCDSYGPSVMSYPDGVEFTQTRTCTKDTETNRRFYETWRLEGKKYIGEISVYSTSTESRVDSRDSYGASLDCGGRDPKTGMWTNCK